MAEVAISKVNNDRNRTLPIFAEIGKRLDGVRQRAFELFERRGRDLGHELEDWFHAEREVFGWPAAEMTRKDGGCEWRPAFDPVRGP